MSFGDRMELWLNNLGAHVPNIIAALIILVVGWLVAKAIQKLVFNMLRRTGLDDRLMRSMDSKIQPEKALSKLVYYVLMVIVLLAAMDVLGISEVLDPLKNMANRFFEFIPNIVAAALIGFIGYVIAKIAAGLVGMAAGFLENLSARIGLSTQIDLTKIVRTVVFILVFVPILIAALDALSLRAITEPAKDMLTAFIDAIPRIFAAALIIGIFYIGGKFVTGLLKDLLASMGTDRLAERLGLNNIVGTQTNTSTMLANIAFFFIMFIGIITGIEQLRFERLTNIMSEIFELTGQIAFGLVILILGNWLANLAYRTMSNNRTDTFLASIARIAILGLFLAIALRTMGIADEIVNLAFGLTLGAIAVAVALSFGLGGREAAGEEMRRILDKFHNDKADPKAGSSNPPSGKRPNTPPPPLPPRTP